MQADLEQNFPELDIQILGMNERGQEVGNADATKDKTIPWLQDVDVEPVGNPDGVSDVWMNSWPVEYRDVAIVDANNVQVDVYNLTTYDLANAVNYATLRQKLIDVAQGQTQPTSWTNPAQALDVNDDTFVSPIDALLVINELNSGGPRQLSPPSAGDAPPPYLDTSGDGYATSIDALLVLNYLNAQPISAVAAHSVAAVPAVASAETPPTTVEESPQTTSKTLAAVAAALAVDEAFASHRRRSPRSWRRILRQRSHRLSAGSQRADSVRGCAAAR